MEVVAENFSFIINRLCFSLKRNSSLILDIKKYYWKQKLALAKGDKVDRKFPILYFYEIKNNHITNISYDCNPVYVNINFFEGKDERSSRTLKPKNYYHYPIVYEVCQRFPKHISRNKLRWYVSLEKIGTFDTPDIIYENTFPLDTDMDGRCHFNNWENIYSDIGNYHQCVHFGGPDSVGDINYTERKKRDIVLISTILVLKN